MTVRYNPADPGDSVIESWASRWFFILMLSVLGIGFMAAGQGAGYDRQIVEIYLASARSFLQQAESRYRCAASQPSRSTRTVSRSVPNERTAMALSRALNLRPSSR